MKKLNYLWMVAAVVIFTSCNGNLEERVRDLEGRVAVLESQGAPVRATPQAQAQQPTESEVKPEGPLPGMQFSKEEHDFGTINDGDIVEHKFSFKNVGDAPLIITNATATCGCTVPEWPKEPIAVGASGDILVRFNSRNKPGNQAKTVTITANTFPSANKVRIRANVLKAEGAE
jgi:hypothetical protein